MKQAAEDSKLIGERFWSRWAILRRAGTGTNDPAGDLQRRANLVSLLKLAGPMALRDWMQTARRRQPSGSRRCTVGKREPQPEGASSGAEALSLLPMADFDTAQALLAQVPRDAELAEIAYTEWRYGSSQTVRKIALGLAAREDAVTTGAKLRDATTGGGIPGQL